MHPDITIQLARQHAAELATDMTRRRPARHPGWRAALGTRLVRWGHRLAPATPFAGASPTRRRPATMGP